MTTIISPTPKQQFFDSNGDPLTGGKLYTYAAGTTTPLSTYTDQTGSTANANPVILDSRGEANVWLSDASYKYVLKTAADVTLWTVDNVGGDALIGALAVTDLTVTGSITLSDAPCVITGTATFASDIDFAGEAITVDGTLGVAGDVSVVDLAATGTITSPSITLADSLTITAALAITSEVSGSDGYALIASNGGASDFITLRTNAVNDWVFEADGQLLGPTIAPTSGSHYANKTYVDSVVPLASSGLIPHAIGAVVSSALVAGDINVAGVVRDDQGEFSITLSSATTSTAKTMVFVTILGSNVTGGIHAPQVSVTSTTVFVVRFSAGHGPAAASDQNFMFAVYSLP